jgi:hypothetical protein
MWNQPTFIPYLARGVGRQSRGLDFVCGLRVRIHPVNHYKNVLIGRLVGPESGGAKLPRYRCNCFPALREQNVLLQRG